MTTGPLSPPPPLDSYLQFLRDVRADQRLEFVSGTAGGRYWLLRGPNNYRTGNKVFIVGQRSFASFRRRFFLFLAAASGSRDAGSIGMHARGLAGDRRGFRALSSVGIVSSRYSLDYMYACMYVRVYSGRNYRG